MPALMSICLVYMFCYCFDYSCYPTTIFMLCLSYVSCHESQLPSEWTDQFESGIQTIAVIQAGHGLLQLGSCKIVLFGFLYIVNLAIVFFIYVKTVYCNLLVLGKE